MMTVLDSRVRYSRLDGKRSSDAPEAGVRMSLDILRVAPLVVGHEANPSTLGFT